MKLTLIAFLFGIVALLLFNESEGISEKKKQKKNKRKNKNYDIKESPLVYSSEEDKASKLQEIKAGLSDSAEIDNTDYVALEIEEKELKKNLFRAILDNGEDSLEKAAALHGLGRNMYQQKKYDELVDAAQEIVRIHEEVDGKESLKTAQALGNVGSVSNRLGRTKECGIAMNRALYIMIKEYGEESKEVLLHRAKMLTFQISEGRDGPGLSYEDYKSEL
jgi:predicted HTH domain antitoxin